MEHYFEFIVDGLNTDEANELYDEILDKVYLKVDANCAGGVQPYSDEVHYSSDRFEVSGARGYYIIYDNTTVIGYVATFTLLQHALEYVKLLEGKDV